MRALGDDAHEPVALTEEGEDLAGLAVFHLTQADAAVGAEGHYEIIVRADPAAALRTSSCATAQSALRTKRSRGIPPRAS